MIIISITIIARVILIGVFVIMLTPTLIVLVLRRDLEKTKGGIANGGMCGSGNLDKP